MRPIDGGVTRFFFSIRSRDRITRTNTNYRSKKGIGTHTEKCLHVVGCTPLSLFSERVHCRGAEMKTGIKTSGLDCFSIHLSDTDVIVTVRRGLQLESGGTSD